jgi:hypothetical protein
MNDKKPNRILLKKKSTVIAVVVCLLVLALSGGGYVFDAVSKYLEKRQKASLVADKQFSEYASRNRMTAATKNVSNTGQAQQGGIATNEAGETQTLPPLTDMAPAPRSVKVTAEEAPAERIKKMNLPEAPQYQTAQKMPAGMDVKNPPQWTKTIATPNFNATPPDPLTPPPMAVNPERVPQPDAQQ